MEIKRFAAGTRIFAEGDPGDTAFLIESGVVEVSLEADGNKTVLGRIEPGGLFGEMALINDKPRMATTTALEDTVCFLVPEAVLDEELNRSSALVKALVLSFIQHVRHLTGLLEAAQGTSEAEVEFFLPDSSGAYTKGH